MNIQELAQFAQTIVLEAGKMVQQAHQQPLFISEKKDFADLVTEVDQQVERFLTKAITTHYPTHRIVGEEGGLTGHEAGEVKWVIDPIDGTTNFIQRFPFYAISVGIVYKGEGIIGVVYNPSTNELFHAVKGHGAYCNEQKLTLKPTLAVQETVVSTTMFWEDNATQNAVHPAIVTLYHETRAIRMLGGAALSLCEIAKGTLGAYIMPNLAPWDYAGGVIILEEAGGVITNLKGEGVQYEQDQSILASHPAIHQHVREKF